MKDDLKRAYQGIPLEELRELLYNAKTITLYLYSNIFDILKPLILKKIEDNYIYIESHNTRYSFLSSKKEQKEEITRFLNRFLQRPDTAQMIKEYYNDLEKSKQYSDYLYDLNTLKHKLYQIYEFNVGIMAQYGDTMLESHFEFDAIYSPIYDNEELYLEINKNDRDIRKEVIFWDREGTEHAKVHFISGTNLTWYKKYKELKNYVEEIKNELSNGTPQKRSLTNDDFFDQNGYVDSYFLQDGILENYDLSYITFKSIEGLNLSKNVTNLKLNFKNLDKTLRGTNIEGYNTKGYMFTHWNLEDANMIGTNAKVDILTCNITLPTKNTPGTRFGEDNKFYFGGLEKTIEEVEQMGIKVYRKEYKDE